MTERLKTVCFLKLVLFALAHDEEAIIAEVCLSFARSLCRLCCNASLSLQAKGCIQEICEQEDNCDGKELFSRRSDDLCKYLASKLCLVVSSGECEKPMLLLDHYLVGISRLFDFCDDQGNVEISLLVEFHFLFCILVFVLCNCFINGLNERLV